MKLFRSVEGNFDIKAVKILAGSDCIFVSKVLYLFYYIVVKTIVSAASQVVKDLSHGGKPLDSSAALCGLIMYDPMLNHLEL